MVLNVVATRDIEPDEEIFLDYGKSFLDSVDWSFLLPAGIRNAMNSSHSLPTVPCCARELFR